ncbi:hypothetical protein V6N12_005926 [Hibiscus sabdariffa]|uniref:Uncharacterized protein n=1 Tax=Hibiscus sabdariffa TaxID=183260 RepID=A0ABR2EWH1_9ROSI
MHGRHCQQNGVPASAKLFQSTARNRAKMDHPSGVNDLVLRIKHGFGLCNDSLFHLIQNGESVGTMTRCAHLAD